MDNTHCEVQHISLSICNNTLLLLLLSSSFINIIIVFIITIHPSIHFLPICRVAWSGVLVPIPAFIGHGAVNNPDTLPIIIVIRCHNVQITHSVTEGIT